MSTTTSGDFKTKFVEMMFYYDDVHKAFNRKAYTDKFEEFYENFKPLFFDFEEYYNSLDSEEVKEEVIDSIAQEFTKKADFVIGNLNRRRREIQIFDFNLALVVLVNPSLLEFRSKSTEELANRIVKMWNDHFPKEKIGLTYYGDISSGFKKKFCYITTATCQVLNKGDNCKELEAFRNYRDSYLESFEEGREWIKKYYNLAPSIIKGIEKEGKEIEIYTYIWNEYLNKCLDMINNNENLACKEKYEAMVNELANKYVFK